MGVSIGRRLPRRQPAEEERIGSAESSCERGGQAEGEAARQPPVRAARVRGVEGHPKGLKDLPREPRRVPGVPDNLRSQIRGS